MNTLDQNTKEADTHSPLEIRKLAFHVTPELWERVSIAAIRQQRSMKALCTEAIQASLDAFDQTRGI